MLSNRCFIQLRYLKKAKKGVFGKTQDNYPNVQLPISQSHNHIVQCGDPVLREICKDVPKDMIKTEEIQYVISTLRKVINRNLMQ